MAVRAGGQACSFARPHLANCLELFLEDVARALKDLGAFLKILFEAFLRRFLRY